MTIRRIPEDVAEAADMTAELMRGYRPVSESVVTEERELFASRNALRRAAIAVLAFAVLSAAASVVAFCI